MRYERVLLIKPAYQGSYYGALHPPVGLGYIGESLAHHNIEYDVMDMSFRYKTKDLKKKIGTFKPDLIGVSMMSFMYNITYLIIQKIKAEYPEIGVAIGGPHGSTYKEEILKSVAEVDYVITLEGEETIVELCGEKKLSNIKGLVFRNNGEVIYTGNRRFIKNPDVIPFPKYRNFELNKYVFNDIDIASSRGCPYQCIFCSVKAVSGRQLRVRSAPNVVDEIEYWYHRGYRKFNFVDDNLTFYYDRVFEMCDEIEKRGLKNLKMTNANGIRADRADRKLLKRMREVGFYYIGFGVECGNDRILKNIKKGETIQQIRRAVQDAIDLGYDVVLNFLVGSPGETWKDVEDSVAFAREFPVLDVRFNNLTPTPKSELFEWLTKKGYFVRQPEDYLNDITSWSYEPVYNTPEMSVYEKRRALEYTRNVRKEILKKTFIRKVKHLRLIAKLFAPLAVSEQTMNLLMHSRHLLRLAEALRGR